MCAPSASSCNQHTPRKFGDAIAAITAMNFIWARALIQPPLLSRHLCCIHSSSPLHRSLLGILQPSSEPGPAVALGNKENFCVRKAVILQAASASLPSSPGLRTSATFQGNLTLSTCHFQQSHDRRSSKKDQLPSTKVEALEQPLEETDYSLTLRSSLQPWMMTMLRMICVSHSQSKSGSIWSLSGSFNGYLPILSAGPWIQDHCTIAFDDIDQENEIKDDLIGLKASGRLKVQFSTVAILSKFRESNREPFLNLVTKLFIWHRVSSQPISAKPSTLHWSSQKQSCWHVLTSGLPWRWLYPSQVIGSTASSTNVRDGWSVLSGIWFWHISE